MTYPEIKASQFPFLFRIDILFFSFLIAVLFFAAFPFSPRPISHTPLFLFLFPIDLSAPPSFPVKTPYFSLESYSLLALSVAPADCEHGALHLLNIIRNIQFLNYTRILSDHYQIIIRKYYQNIICCTRPF